MFVVLRWIWGVCAFSLLLLCAALFRADPARREGSLAGITFVLFLPYAALWVSQLSYLCFAASRLCRSRALKRPPLDWERFVLKGVRTTIISVIALPVLWVLWSCFRR